MPDVLPDPAAPDAMAAQLEASGRYRLLRRFETCTLHPVGDPTTLCRGGYLDIETTGVDGRRDEILELAMVPFDYDPDGRLCAVHARSWPSTSRPAPSRPRSPR